MFREIKYNSFNVPVHLKDFICSLMEGTGQDFRVIECDNYIDLVDMALGYSLEVGLTYDSKYSKYFLVGFGFSAKNADLNDPLDKNTVAFTILSSDEAQNAKNWTKNNNKTLKKYFMNQKEKELRERKKKEDAFNKLFKEQKVKVIDKGKKEIDRLNKEL